VGEAELVAELLERHALHLRLAELGRADDDDLGARRLVDGGDAKLLADLRELEEDTAIGGRLAGRSVASPGHRYQASEKEVMPCASYW
jgi:hypothetical protein